MAKSLAKIPGLTGARAVTAVALHLPASLSYEEWVDIGEALQRLERGVLWWIGDWCLHGQRRWGEKYTEAIEATGLAWETVRKAAQLAKRFESGSRLPELSWSHHLEVAFLPPTLAQRLLARAAKHGWSVRETRMAACRARTNLRLEIPAPGPSTCSMRDLDALIRAGKRFGCVLADPPWQHQGRPGLVSADWHYEVMPLSEIAALPVPDLVLGDAHLHLWVPNNLLVDGIAVLHAWGFEYRSHFAWIKPNANVGQYYLPAHEILLLGVKGKAGGFRDPSLRSWEQFPRGAHSEKPDEVRRRIERASPGPYLELFARKTAPGWVCWGNQIRRKAFEASLRPLVAAE